jgi:hypothetical protein
MSALRSNWSASVLSLGAMEIPLLALTITTWPSSS